MRKELNTPELHYKKNGSRLNGFILLAFYASFFLFLLAMLVDRYLSGGDSWQQGDWLVSNAAGPVRRGLGGSMFIWLSDTFSINILLLVMATQFLLFTIFMLIVVKKSFEIGLSDRLLFLLLSPAFIGFYVNDFQAAFRKELLVFSAFLPLLFASNNTSKNYLVATIAALVFSISVFFHEANVLLFPFFAFGLWLVALAVGDRLVWGICAAVGAIASLAAVTYAVKYSAVDDVSLLCKAVVDRGVDPAICDGAISWMSNEVSDTTKWVIWLIGNYSQSSFIFSYLLAVVPVFLMLKGFRQRYRTFVLVCASSIFFLPLYFVTIDWGRWIFIHVSAISLILLIAARFSFLPDFRKPLPIKGFVVMLFFSSMWGITHVGGGLRQGYPTTAESEVKGKVMSYLGLEKP